MDSLFKKRMDFYAHCKERTRYYRNKYQESITELKKILKYENQCEEDSKYVLDQRLREYEKGYVISQGGDIHPFYSNPTDENNRKTFYNKYCIGPRMQNYSILRNTYDNVCKDLKKDIKNAQRLEERARNDIIKYFDDRPVFFVATVRDVYQEVDECIKKAKNLPADYKYENHDSRTWGFFYDINDAIRRIECNATDMNEAGYYEYAVIEPHEKGLLGIDPAINGTLWFKAQYVEEIKNGKTYKVCTGYKMCDQPEWAKHTVGWAL